MNSYLTYREIKNLKLGQKFIEEGYGHPIKGTIVEAPRNIEFIMKDKKSIGLYFVAVLQNGRNTYYEEYVIYEGPEGNSEFPKIRIPRD